MEGRTRWTERAGYGLGMMAGSAFFVKLLDRFTDVPGNQNTQRAYSGAVMVFGLMMIAATIIMAASTKERVSGPAGEKKKQAGIKEKLDGLKLVLLDREDAGGHRTCRHLRSKQARSGAGERRIRTLAFGGGLQCSAGYPAAGGEHCHIGNVRMAASDAVCHRIPDVHNLFRQGQNTV